MKHRLNTINFFENAVTFDLLNIAKCSNFFLCAENLLIQNKFGQNIHKSQLITFSWLFKWSHVGSVENANYIESTIILIKLF